MTDAETKTPLPPFVAAVGNAPASFLQGSFLINGRVLTFQIPLESTDGEAVVAAVKKLAEEVMRASNS